MIFTNNKPRKVKLIKFNSDRSIQSIMGIVKKSIIEYQDEGWEARNSGYIEYNKDSLWGFQKAKIDNLKPCFVVRENDPSPLEFKKDNTEIRLLRKLLYTTRTNHLVVRYHK